MKKIFITLLSLLLMSNTIFPQEKISSGVPDDTKGNYSIPYDVPKVKDIKEVLDRVKKYFVETTPYAIIDSVTGEEIKDFSDIDKDAVIDTRRGEFNLWTYTMGVVFNGMNLVTDVTGDKSFADYAIKDYDFVFDKLPYFRKIDKKFGTNKEQYGQLIHMAALDHCGSIGAALIKTYEKKQDKRYRDIIDTAANYICNKQYKLEDGTLARQQPQTQSLWADDFYMSIPFLAQMGKLTGDKKYWDEAVKQVLQLSSRLFDKNKNLFDHGWSAGNDKYDPKYYWSRANGWAMMAMAELLTVLPQNYPQRDNIVDLVNLTTQQLAGLQDGTGLWHQMLDKESSYLETSGTAMFVFSIARGINGGWIDYTFAPVALAGWAALTTRVLIDGQIQGTCIGTAMAYDNIYYFSRPTSVNAMHSYGPVLLAGAEIITLLENPKVDISFDKRIIYKLKPEN